MKHLANSANTILWDKTCDSPKIENRGQVQRAENVKVGWYKVHRKPIIDIRKVAGV